jgi:MFS family permease
LNPGSGTWLAALCSSRVLAATWFVAYSAVLPLTQAQWGLSGSEAGMIQAAFYLGYLTSLFIVGFIADHFGAKRTYILAGIASCASPWAFVFFADGFWSAFWLHALTGLCQGGNYTPALALINDHVGRERRGRAMGYLIAGSSAGYALCLAVAGAALTFTDWRGALTAVACLPVMSWLLGIWVLRETRNFVHPRPAGESLLAAIPAVWRNKRGMLSIWGYTFHNWELLGLWAWLPAFLTAVLVFHGNENPGTLALIFAGMTYLANIAGSIVGGTMADRWGDPDHPHLVVRQPALSFSIGWLIARADRAKLVALACPLQLRWHRRLLDALHRARRKRAAALPRRRICSALGGRLRRRRGQPCGVPAGRARRLGGSWGIAPRRSASAPCFGPDDLKACVP